MNRQIIATSLTAIGIIFFLASAFHILQENIGLFGGVVFVMLGGLTWAVWPRTNTEGKK
jgi:hypothetical protein